MLDKKIYLLSLARQCFFSSVFHRNSRGTCPSHLEEKDVYIFSQRSSNHHLISLSRPVFSVQVQEMKILFFSSGFLIVMKLSFSPPAGARRELVLLGLMGTALEEFTLERMVTGDLRLAADSGLVTMVTAVPDREVRLSRLIWQSGLNQRVY